jgi:acrylyl-CoA reductase (NADPH)/3-hydroxypropionyl-CoA dehydratase/3-hydroxypropionyl-CoA synthetase
VQRLLEQAASAGRADAARRAVEALQTGWEQGIDAGLAREARLFAEAVVDPCGGKAGIRAFLDRRAAPLPARAPDAPQADDRVACAQLEATGALLPVGEPFWPGVTPVPRWQYAHGVTRDARTGAARHGEPRQAEHELLAPVEDPGATEALVYVLASEVNFNDVWAITGIPVSPFDAHDEDRQTTGSGGVGLVVRLGSEARREGRLRVGDLVTIYSGQSELLSPFAARDPMSADFRIQGYETRTGSHAQFLVVQAPQLHPVPQDLTLEAAGSYVLNLGTIVRALFTTLRIQPGRTMFVEGAATGTGLEALKVAARNGVQVAGMVSSAERAAVARAAGAVATLDRGDPRLRHLFTPVPEGAEAVAEWERQGGVLVDGLREQLDGRLADYVVSHAGATAFPRSFQLLADGGTLTFYGASSGYWFSFVGKRGGAGGERMLREAGARAGESALVYYGTACDGDGLTDAAGLELIEAARAAGLRLCVATYTEAQRDFVLSLGFGDAVRGVISIAEVARRVGDDFEWPSALPALPDPRAETARFREAVRAYQERTVKPFGQAVGRVLRSTADPRGAPDLVIERAGHDALGVSTSLVKPFTGRVVYAEDMGGRRYTFYAPQVWTRQRRILMPTARILGTHLCNAYEVARMNEMLDAGLLEVTPPTVVDWRELPDAHQAMWDNRHAGATYVCNHALPALGLRSRDELFEAWASGLRRTGPTPPAPQPEEPR